jgi:hypothetical protein
MALLAQVLSWRSLVQKKHDEKRQHITSGELFCVGVICWWWRNRRGVIGESPEIVLEESEKAAGGV